MSLVRFFQSYTASLHCLRANFTLNYCIDSYADFYRHNTVGDAAAVAPAAEAELLKKCAAVIDAINAGT
jgi:hypothetical protein